MLKLLKTPASRAWAIAAGAFDKLFCEKGLSSSTTKGRWESERHAAAHSVQYGTYYRLCHNRWQAVVDRRRSFVAAALPCPADPNDPPMSTSTSPEIALSPGQAMTPQAMRNQMPITEQIAYFDHAAVAPVSGPAGEAIQHWLKQATELGDTVWLEWAKGVEETRRHGAEMLSASKDEIALVTSTTHGINFVAEGLDWNEGDNVVILSDEYPSNVYPWMHQWDRGVETRMVQTDFGRFNPDRLREACDNRTRVVSVSWVGFQTGYRQDLSPIAEIAHAAGAYFFVDAIQALGVFPLDVNDVPIDFLAADGHKWMLGAEGAGIAYVRKEHLEKLRTIGVGSNSVVGAKDFSTIDYTLRPTATRYEGGSANMPGLLGLGASLDFLAKWNPQDRVDAVLAVTDLACEELRRAGAKIHTHRELEPSGHDPRSGIVCFTMPDQDPMQQRQKALEAGVAMSCRGGKLRISAHAYNNADDVARLVEVVSHKD